MHEARKKDTILNKTSQAPVSLALRLPGLVHLALRGDTADRRGTIGLYNRQIRAARDASRPEPNYRTS